MNHSPKVIVFDVNETLSDTTALADRFEAVGAPGLLAGTWFAQVLRDGFALLSTGDSAPFATIAATLLDTALDAAQLNRPYAEAKKYLLDSFAEIPLHADVAPGLADLSAAGVRLVALTNGAVSTASALFTTAGVDDFFAQVLSVEDASTWKPGAGSYHWAAETCGVDPSDMMLVAVHPWDIHGADRAGLRTAWVNRNSSAYPSYFAPAELQVSSVIDLAHQVL